jgi:hypothetical protein
MLRNTAIGGLLPRADLRLTVRLPCIEEQINLASACLVGEINANATSRLLFGHGSYAFQRFGLGQQPA